MVRLYIVRHAESEWNPICRYQGLLDPDLSPRGEKQAELLGKEFSHINIDAIYSSPLRRTLKTAKAIAKNHNIEVIEDKRIIEIDHGLWSGLLQEEVKERFGEDFKLWLEEPHKVKFPEGESLEDVRQRVESFLEDVKRKHWDQSIVVVSHTVPIRVMYCILLGVPLSVFWSFGCDNASYSVVHMEERRNVIMKLNMTCHLGEFYVEAHKGL
ncbi:phosphoserine phosphatase PspA [Thermocrinis minervae]|uniref:Probable phosphoglycerate mutase n=1 Tax=Thermocrinis minervae TaxID=381751 RepID=A0A1M6RBG6_9AQUI|nr:histidine phosphatase family protein [Thermocrinis minervae]SHK29835.1 probable phosphoglycerate mutase [Thermocrinis minervae]